MARSCRRQDRGAVPAHRGDGEDVRSSHLEPPHLSSGHLSPSHLHLCFHPSALRTSALHTCRCVNVAFETSLAEGLRFERAIFYSTFATHDQKAGMAAFAAKEKPNFKNE